MKRGTIIKSILAASMALALVVGVGSIATTNKVEAASSGWVQSGDDWYYYVNGSKATGWKKVGNYWYYFESNGVMVSNAVRTINGKAYYFNTSGSMATGPRWISETSTGTKKWHYVQEDGSLKTGWFKLSGVWYYGAYDGISAVSSYTGYAADWADHTTVHSNGVLADTWALIRGSWYCFDINCKMIADTSNVVGMVTLENCLTNTYEYNWIPSSVYYDAPGQLAHGWRKIDDKWYFFDTMYHDSGSTYTRIANGLTNVFGVKVDGKYYWFSNEGYLETGWNTYWHETEEVDERITRYYTTNGALSGWQQLDGYWYYFGRIAIEDGKYEDDVMVTGWQRIDGKWYYFNTEIWYSGAYYEGQGIMLTGWQEIDGNVYNFGGNGSMRTGWQLIDGNYYYFGGSGAMQRDTWVGSYHLNADGVWDNM